MSGRIIWPRTSGQTEAQTIAQLRSQLKDARAVATKQRIDARNARQLLTRIQARHRAGDRYGAEWLIENWQDQLQKWKKESKARNE